MKVWLALGEDVRIFTARVNRQRGQVNAMRTRRAIEAWSKRHLRHVLPVTHETNWDMTCLQQVFMNLTLNAIAALSEINGAR